MPHHTAPLQVRQAAQLRHALTLSQPLFNSVKGTTLTAASSKAATKGVMDVVPTSRPCNEGRPPKRNDCCIQGASSGSLTAK